MKSLVRSLALAAAAAAIAGEAAGQQETGSYVVRLGRDTVAYETFVRTRTLLSSQLVTRAPRTTIRYLDAHLRPDGTVSRLVMRTRSLSDPTQPLTVTTVEFGADSADVRIVRGDSVRTMRVAAAGSMPLVGDSYSLYEQVGRVVRRTRGDSVVIAMLPPGNPSTVATTFRRAGRDTIIVRNQVGASRMWLDANGRLGGFSGRGSTRQIEAERVAMTPADVVAGSFLAAERVRGPMGSLSPRDSVVMDVGAANVSVAYGRPSARGRRIMGEVVPFGQVWRTGANEATHLRTTRDLMFGNVRVPAGSYTIWTLPGASEWHLIINRQTGQWGTVYNAEQDLAHIPLRVRRTDATVEQLTIRVVPDGQGGAIVIAWDDTEVSAPFTVP